MNFRFKQSFRSGLLSATLLAALAAPCGAFAAPVVNILYDFGVVPNGNTPQAAPVAGPNGVYYGTTNGGGPTGNGTVYELIPDAASASGWKQKTIHAFSGTDGSVPRLGIAGRHGWRALRPDLERRRFRRRRGVQAHAARRRRDGMDRDPRCTVSTAPVMAPHPSARWPPARMAFSTAPPPAAARGQGGAVFSLTPAGRRGAHGPRTCSTASSSAMMASARPATSFTTRPRVRSPA